MADSSMVTPNPKCVVEYYPTSSSRRSVVKCYILYSTIYHASWHTVGLRLWQDWRHEELALLRS